MPIPKPKQATPTFELKYTASKTGALFHKSDDFVRGIMGPIGSGKSVAMCVEMFIRASRQAPSKDGIRRTRWIVIRNTAPELETTTIKTWLDWFPESVFGKMNRKPPITHKVKIHDIEMEVVFLALDRPEDVKKLLSLEATGIWINEARYVLKEVLDAASGRVGRYPSPKDKPEGFKGQWPTWYGMIMDTNPPDDASWWYKMAEEEHPEGWKFWKQPSGEAKDAENIDNLPPRYYKNMQAGKTQEWIDVYVHGKYGFIQEGRPVYGKNYNDELHSTKELKYDSKLPLFVGLDFGLTPSAIFCQKDAFGTWYALEEMITPDGETWPIPEFARSLRSHMNTYYKGATVRYYGDPSGGFRDQQGKTAFDLFKKEGIHIQAAPTNKIEMRRDAVVAALLRLISGRPGAVICRKKCPLLRRGFNGGYHYRRMNIGGEAKYTPEPEKNRFSHPHDAFQYALCGGGEYRQLMTNKSMATKTIIQKDFSLWK